MDFAPPRRPRNRAENIVPMINVVFLLLIFFLMSAQIAPPLPVEVTSPTSASENPAITEHTLVLSREGVPYFAGAEGDAALTALARVRPERLALRADAALPASEVARLLPRLAEFGVRHVDLVTGARR